MLAVVGAPGSGKTTLLRHAARQACAPKRPPRGRGNLARDIPVLLYLRDHATRIGRPPGSLGGHVVALDAWPHSRRRAYLTGLSSDSGMGDASSS